MANDPLTSWLNTLPTEDGFPCISTPRRYTFDESAYDEQYQIKPGALASGKGVLNLLASHECDMQGPLMEIGCGTGHFSLGLASGSPFSQTLLTDPSTAFLNITRKKLQANNIPLDRIKFAVFTGEDLDRVPANLLSCVALRSTLHHVFDIDAFFTATSRALRPGGAVIFQEPFAEGFLLMAAMAQFLPQSVAAAGGTLTDADRNTLQNFVDTMTFYLRRDVDKAQCEDKHVFRAEELVTLCQQKGMAARFYPNLNTEQFAVTPPDLNVVTFGRWFHDYTKYCMSWNESMMQHFQRHLAPACQLVEKATSGTSGPHFSGIMVARKNPA